MKNASISLVAFGVGLVATVASAQIPYPNPINHVILIDQENRTPDNLFGSNSSSNPFYLPGAVVATSGKAYIIANGKKNVITVKSVSAPLSSVVGVGGSLPGFDYDPGHSHSLWLSACDAPVKTDPSNLCAMDGFNHVTITCDVGVTGCPGTRFPTYAYVQYSDVAPYFQMAAQYGYANYMFQTNQGPSFPSHQFTFGGTSQPGLGTEPDWFVAENAKNYTNGYGCTASTGTTVQLVNPATQDELTSMYPCFNHSTLADVFAAATPQITWTYYTSGPKSLLTAPNALEALCTNTNGVCTGNYWSKGKANGFVDAVNPADILTDISNCNLKQVNWVNPLGLQSDHAGATDGSGPSWVASIINAIGTQPKCADGETYWNNTVILVTWDDWGGWYDHVVPPAVNSKAPAGTSAYVYGFRVPLIVVSAYTPSGTVSNVMGLDFGAMLKFIEEIFNVGTIPPGTYADYYANDDLGEFFNFNNPPRSFQSINAPLTKEVFLDPDRPITDADND
ncbi:MAG TPA: alkaline phosphatase family protein [Candidatus Acidoferrum sp.]|nr:alkaline phosphatase family protein [Candidatus Acidoferrum sp.]